LRPKKDLVDQLDRITVIVDQTNDLFVQGASIDWQITEDGKQGFHFDNPNAVAK
jgi:Fe-S cluster assembly iron-binding protein IscA